MAEHCEALDVIGLLESYGVCCRLVVHDHFTSRDKHFDDITERIKASSYYETNRLMYTSRDGLLTVPS